MHCIPLAHWTTATHAVGTGNQPATWLVEGFACALSFSRSLLVWAASCRILTSPAQREHKSMNYRGRSAACCRVPCAVVTNKMRWCVYIRAPKCMIMQPTVAVSECDSLELQDNAHWGHEERVLSALRSLARPLFSSRPSRHLMSIERVSQ